jgi:hypothetical protein
MYHDFAGREIEDLEMDTMRRDAREQEWIDALDEPLDRELPAYIRAHTYQKLDEYVRRLVGVGSDEIIEIAISEYLQRNGM